MKPYFTTSTAKKRVSDLPGCGGCGLNKTANTPNMKPTGKGKRKILVLTEAPSKTDDLRGKLFSGDDSKLLRSVLSELGVDLDDDCIKASACRCHPEGNRAPEPEEVSYCRANVMATIKEYKPRLIIALGGAALRSLYEHRCDFDMDMMRWRGALIPDYELGAYVLITYHPMYVRREADSENGTVIRRQFVSDIQRALDALQSREVFLDRAQIARSRCSLPSDDEAVRLMNEIMETANRAGSASVVCAFDYETTGMKPDRAGHSIYCASIASSTTGNSFSFFLNNTTRETFVRFLKAKNIWKVAHNHKFESRWSKKCLNTRVAKWVGDTMLIQHSLDNRTGVTGLKFQVAVRYGDMNYAKLGGLGDWGDDANKIHSYERHDQDDLRLYNALDSLYTLWLYKDQLAEMKEVRKTFGKHSLMRGQAASFAEGLKLMMDTSATFQVMEENGMKVDMGYLSKCDATLGTMIYDAREEFLKTKVAREWKKRFGVVNVNSPVQLRTVLYKYLGFEPPKQTDNDEDATDKEALMTLNDPELIKLLELKKLCKARGTYVRQIQREVVDSVIHTSFSLNIARTFRSSSQYPNMQNIPVRDKTVGTIIRTLFTPFTPEDHVVEVDLKGAEVGTAACYNQDPKLIKYVENPTLDMHRDIVERIFFVKREWITKEIRYCGKNMFVFPQFYGSSANNCANALWHASGNLFVGPDKVPMRDWLANHNINSHADFEAHVREVERYFWEDMFSVYTEWKEEWWQSYLELGYVDTFTGFRCSMLMDKRKAINYPIQGDAFHLEAWIANRVRAKLKDLEGPIRKVKLMNLIHDSLIANVPAMCLDQFVNLVQDTVAETRKYHSWINVPITAEVEVAPMGKPWIDKKPYEVRKAA